MVLVVGPDQRGGRYSSGMDTRGQNPSFLLSSDYRCAQSRPRQNPPPTPPIVLLVCRIVFRQWARNSLPLRLCIRLHVHQPAGHSKRLLPRKVRHPRNFRRPRNTSTRIDRSRIWRPRNSNMMLHPQGSRTRQSSRPRESRRGRNRRRPRRRRENTHSLLVRILNLDRLRLSPALLFLPFPLPLPLPSIPGYLPLARSAPFPSPLPKPPVLAPSCSLGT
jgi:hypothetical protein